VSPNLLVQDFDRAYAEKGLRGEQGVSDIIVGSIGSVVTPYPVIN
jgi:hypothetical protein